MKKTISALAVIAASVLSMSAHAQSASPELQISGDIHGGSGYTFRGNDLSNDELSLGLKLRATHASGVYGALSTDLVKLKNPHPAFVSDDGRQSHNQFTLGYNHQLGDATIGAGFTRHAFHGSNDVSGLSFSEVFVNAHWNGFDAKLAHNVSGADWQAAGFAKGDTYAELGYTHQIGKFNVGADLGLSWHKDKHPAVDDGVQFTQLRAGYAVNDNLAIQLSHQFDSGEGSAKDTTNIKVSYSF